MFARKYDRIKYTKNFPSQYTPCSIINWLSCNEMSEFSDNLVQRQNLKVDIIKLRI